MKIAIINTYSNGSTGIVAESIAKFASSKGHCVKMFYGREKTNNSSWIFIGENKSRLLFSNAMTFLTGKVGSFHKSSTKKLIKQLFDFNPDVIHIHNLHGNYLNFKILFDYLATYKGKVIITAHDEFLLTGRCALCFCEKWRKGCSNCKFLNAYPRVLFDSCKKLQIQKLNYLRNIQNLTIITPSLWLQSCFKESLLSFVDCHCIHNGIEKEKPHKFDVSNLIEKNKINILCSAYTWSLEKGAGVIKDLYQLLDKDKFNLIVTGVGDYCKDVFNFDCKKIGLLNRNHFLYLMSKCNLFLNPTFKDNLPTILIESLQMGIPVITFDTGGCKEIIDSTCGVVLSEKNPNAILDELNKFDFSKDWKITCQKKAELFDPKSTLSKYLKLYEEK